MWGLMVGAVAATFVTTRPPATVRLSGEELRSLTATGFQLSPSRSGPIQRFDRSYYLPSGEFVGCGDRPPITRSKYTIDGDRLCVQHYCLALLRHVEGAFYREYEVRPGQTRWAPIVITPGRSFNFCEGD